MFGFGLGEFSRSNDCALIRLAQSLPKRLLARVQLPRHGTNAHPRMGNTLTSMTSSPVTVCSLSDGETSQVGPLLTVEPGHCFRGANKMSLPMYPEFANALRDLV